MIKYLKLKQVGKYNSIKKQNTLNYSCLITKKKQFDLQTNKKSSDEF